MPIFFVYPKPALAITEFCPARLTQMRDTAATAATPANPKDVETASAGAGYNYTLDAQTPRTIVAAAMIADTDDGWYAWRVENVPLEKTTAELKGPYMRGEVTFARSAPLDVTFPESVVVHHAWVTHASTSAETLIGWDAVGDFACEVPDFPDGGPGPRVITRRQAAAVIVAAPKITPPPGIAVPVPQPFPIDCEVPFRRALVVRPVQPEFPFSMRDGGGGFYSSVVEVAVGDDGRLIDAWTYASSGERAIDQSALRAAKASSYQAATSYCQNVRGEYLFRADFHS
jgi:hypothetical protein